MNEDRRLLAMLVEDMDDLAFLLARELDKRGWETERYAKLVPALARIKEPPYPALVLLDLNLPDSRPAETVRSIPEIMKYAPVMVISGRADPELIKKVEETGAIFQTKLTTKAGGFLAKVVEVLGLYKTRHLDDAQRNLSLLREYIAENALQQ